MANIEQKVESLLTNTIESLGYELYDVIYEKEAQDYYLRIFIDKPEGIDLNDCEKVNDAISDMLDEANYIKDQYFLEVSSPGLERLLRKEKHLQANLENEIQLKLFKSIELNSEEKVNNSKKRKKASLKEISGILKQYDDEIIKLEIEENNVIEIERKNISVMRVKYNW